MSLNICGIMLHGECAGFKALRGSNILKAKVRVKGRLKYFQYLDFSYTLSNE